MPLFNLMVYWELTRIGYHKKVNHKLNHLETSPDFISKVDQPSILDTVTSTVMLLSVKQYERGTKISGNKTLLRVYLWFWCPGYISGKSSNTPQYFEFYRECPYTNTESINTFTTNAHSYVNEETV